MLRCKLCETNDVTTDYIGETKLPLRLRYNEHLRDMIGRKEDTLMETISGWHIPRRTIRHRLLKLGFCTGRKSIQSPDRKIAESIYTSKTPCLAMNERARKR